MQDIQRYVGMTYFAAFALCAWLFPKVFVEIFELMGPGADRHMFANFTLSNLLGVVIAGGLVAYLWKHERVHQWVNEVVDQISKVTWPTGKETRRSTGIVILFSLVLGGILAVMDLVGKKALDLIFQVFS